MNTSIEKIVACKQSDRLRKTAQGSIKALDTEKAFTRRRMEHLENNGMIFATAYWRIDKYLYLIYPMVNGQRKRQYIGKNPEKVRTALDAIGGGKLHSDLSGHLKEIEQSLKEARHCLTNVIRSESETKEAKIEG